MVVIADDADVLVVGGEQAQPEVLGDVGVLILVHEDVAEPALVLRKDVFILLEDGHDVKEEIAEVAGVQGAQALLILAVECTAHVVELAGLGGGDVIGRPGAVFPAVDQRGEHARRPAFLVDILGLDELFQEAQLVVRVEDGEGGFEAYEFRVAAQNLHTERVEGAQPWHPFDGLTNEAADAGFHLAGRLVGEGDGEDLIGAGGACVQQMGDAGGERAGFAGSGPGEHKNGAVERFDGGALHVVEPVHIGCGAGRHGARRQAAGFRGGRRFKGALFIPIIHGAL